MIVIDASALVEVLLVSSVGLDIADRILAPGVSLHAPHLLDLEVAQVVRRYCRSGDMTGERGRQTLTDLADFGITRYSHTWFLGRVWELRHNLTVYDAAYLALAEALGAPLVTRDARLSSAPGHRATIERF